MALQNQVSPGTKTGFDKNNAINKNRFHDPYLRQFPPIKIYNVGQWALGGKGFINRLTCGGTWLIPLRKDGQEVSDPLEVPDPYTEYSPQGLGSSEKEISVSGMRLAQEIINQSDGEDLSPGVNNGKSPENDLRQWGVFIAKGDKPTTQEIAEASERYKKTLMRYVEEARQLWALNEKKWIQPIHYFAAKILRVKDDWNKQVIDSVAPETFACPACMNQILKGARKCVHCGEWIEKVMEALTAPDSGKAGKKG